MTRGKKLLLAGLLALAVIIFAFASKRPAVVRLAPRLNLIYPFRLAEEEGMLDQRKLRIEIVQYPKTVTNDLSEQKEFEKKIRDGQVDFAILSTDEFLSINADRPGQYKAVGFFSDSESLFSTSIITKKNSDIKLPLDLAGKKIAAESGVDLLLLEKYMGQLGVSDFTPLKIHDSLWLDYLKNGKVDAVWANEPRVSEGVAQDSINVLVKNPTIESATDLSGAVTDVIVVRWDYLKTNPEVVDEIKNMLEKTTSVSQEKIREVGLKLDGDNVAEARAISVRTHPQIQTTKQLDRELFQRIADYIFQEKLIKKQVNINDLLY